MQISTETLDVSSVLLFGNELAEVFASGHDTEQDYMQMLDYSTDVLIAENSAELLDAMHSSVQQMGIEIEREDEHSVVAAFIAKNNKELWEEISNVLDGIAMGDFEADDANAFEAYKQTRVTGYDIFLSGLEYADVLQIAELLNELSTERYAKTVKATAREDGWCITCMYEEEIVMGCSELESELMSTYALGEIVASKLNCICNGCELYVDEAAIEYAVANGVTLLH
jgi:hypothetical protein